MKEDRSDRMRCDAGHTEDENRNEAESRRATAAAAKKKWKKEATIQEWKRWIEHANGPSGEFNGVSGAAEIQLGICQGKHETIESMVE